MCVQTHSPHAQSCFLSHPLSCVNAFKNLFFAHNNTVSLHTQSYLFSAHWEIHSVSSHLPWSVGRVSPQPAIKHQRCIQKVKSHSIPVIRAYAATLTTAPSIQHVTLVKVTFPSGRRVDFRLFPCRTIIWAFRVAACSCALQ